VAELNVVGIRQGKASQKIRCRHESLNESVEKLLTDRVQPIGKLTNDLGKLGRHINASPAFFAILGSRTANSKICDTAPAMEICRLADGSADNQRPGEATREADVYSR
jgi:hypothetical protein